MDAHTGFFRCAPFFDLICSDLFAILPLLVIYMNRNNLEIERKFLIRRPPLSELLSMGESSEIEQTYLVPDKEGVRARVRKRGRDGVYTYTHTEKSFITDLTRIEIERTIGRDEYEELLKKADPERQTIKKTRFVLPYEGQVFELDLFPFWEKQAYLEIELESEDQKIVFPPMLDIVREITYDARYTNSALAKSIPAEEIP